MNNTKSGKEAFESLLKGMHLATDIVRQTYGPKGQNCLIECDLNPGHMVANDFQTIVQSIFAEDKYEKIGLDLIKELTEKSQKDSADGRKTTALICIAILDECYKQGLSGLALKNELDALIPIIEN